MWIFNTEIQIPTKGIDTIKFALMELRKLT